MAGAIEVSFPTPDGGVVFADVYGNGERAVVLAHGQRFDKASWKDQAMELTSAGFRVVAIGFRGYGKSQGGPNSRPGFDDMYMDVLAAVRYARETGAKTVAVVGASMGGGASADAVVHGAPGEIDRLVLLAGVPIQHPERIAAPKLFATSEGDFLIARIREQFERAPEPKQLVILGGSAHAQNLFSTDQGPLVMKEILRFLSEAGAATH